MISTPLLRSSIPSAKQTAVLAALGCLVAAAALLPPPAGLSAKAMLGFALVFATILSWATAIVPHFVTSIAFVTLAIALGTAPAESILRGFISSAFGLVYGGLLLGAAADRSGLGRWLAQGLLSKIGRSYSGLLLGILIGSVLLGFLVPASMARMAITVPIVVAVARAAGFATGTRHYNILVLTAVAGGFLVSMGVLPANLMNILVVGMVETAYGPANRYNYGEYMLVAFPVLCAVKVLLYWAVMLTVFGRKPIVSAASSVPEPLSAPAKRLAAILSVTVTLWATDFIHHIAPGWIALAAAAISLIPGLGLLTYRDLFDKSKLIGGMGLVAVLGVAAVLESSGASAVISEGLRGVASLEGRSASFGFAFIALISSAVALVATTVGALAITLPVLGDVSAATGLPIKTSAIAQIAGLSIVYFPYQAVPLMVGLALGNVRYSEGVRVLLPVALVSIPVILPLTMLWLRLIGYLP